MGSLLYMQGTYVVWHPDLSYSDVVAYYEQVQVNRVHEFLASSEKTF